MFFCASHSATRGPTPLTYLTSVSRLSTFSIIIQQCWAFTMQRSREGTTADFRGWPGIGNEILLHSIQPWLRATPRFRLRHSRALAELRQYAHPASAHDGECCLALWT